MPAIRFTARFATSTRMSLAPARSPPVTSTLRRAPERSARVRLFQTTAASRTGVVEPCAPVCQVVCRNRVRFAEVQSVRRPRRAPVRRGKVDGARVRGDSGEERASLVNDERSGRLIADGGSPGNPMRQLSDNGDGRGKRPTRTGAVSGNTRSGHDHPDGTARVSAGMLTKSLPRDLESRHRARERVPISTLRGPGETMPPDASRCSPCSRRSRYSRTGAADGRNQPPARQE